jgi:capsular exopolysaccharide synthesis family protein
MDNHPISETIRQYMGLAWHWAWLLILATVVAGVTAFIVSKRITPVYQASATLLVNEAPANKAADYNSVMTSNLLTQTYSQMMVKVPVLNGVIDELSLKNITADQLEKSVSVQPVRDTQLIMIKVEDPSPQRAADVANRLGVVFANINRSIEADRYTSAQKGLQVRLDQLSLQITDTEKSIAGLGTSAPDLAKRDQLTASLSQDQANYNNTMQSYQQVLLTIAQSTSSVVYIEAATPPAVPIRPRTLLNTGIAALLGLMLSIAFVFIVDALDDTLRSPEDVTKVLGVPVLGVIASHQSPTDMPITASEPRSPVAEAFRSLRTNIQFASVDHPLHTLLVTSPSPEDGKSTISSNLAVILAQNGRKVVLFEADLRRPKVHKMMNLPNREGTSALFVDQEVNLNGQLQTSEVPDLYVITSGTLPPNPAELLGSEKMARILEKISETADLVILDSPPVLVVTDSSVLAPRVDGVLIVMQPGKTKLAAGKHAVDQLKRVGANVIGVVLNNVEISRSSYKYAYYRGYYYNYHKYYSDQDKAGETKENHSKGKKILGLFGSKN